MEIDRTVSQKPIEAHFCTRHTIIEKQESPSKQGLDGDSLFLKKRPPQMRRSFEDQLFSVQLFIASAAFLSIFLRLSEEFFSSIREGFSQGMHNELSPFRKFSNSSKFGALLSRKKDFCPCSFSSGIITVVAPPQSTAAFASSWE